MTTAATLRIDPEFARLIPPHTESEVVMLTQSCVADGIQDPLKTWHGTLLDGHTRYQIAQENDLDYETLELDLPDRDAARTWVLNNQLARRNLHPNGASYLRGKRYLAEKQRQGEYQKDNSCPFVGSTAQRLGAELGVGEVTIKNDAAFTLAVDYLCGDATAVEMGAILSGDTEWTRRDIMDQHKSALREAEAAARVAGASEKEAKQAAKAVVDDAPVPETVSQKVLDAASEAADEVVEETAAIAEEAKAKKAEGKGKQAKPREIAKTKAQEKKRAADEQKAAEVERQTDRYRIVSADIRNLADQLDPDSIDSIITDPPYPEEYVPLYEDLAKLAARVLKPGQSMLVMTGQSYLPQILSLMVPHIRYHWTLAYMTPGATLTVWARKVMTGWKPVLWFVKGDYAGAQVWDVAKSVMPDKDHHEWGQSESGMADLIEKVTRPGDTVLDPFLGAGTTGTEALRLSRNFIGADVDEAAIATALARFSEVVKP